MLFFLSNSDKSLIEELWEYFETTYFSPEVPKLDNFSFGSGTLVTLKTIIVGLTFGLIFASFITIYNKRYIGNFIRKMLREECFDADRAKTLDELGYIKSVGVKHAIKSGGTLAHWVRCVEEDVFNAEMEKKREEFENEHKDEKRPPRFKEVEFKRDFSSMHFYIPEEKKYAADIKFDAKGANWGSFVFVTVVSIIICAFLSYILPDIVVMIDNFISVMNK